MKKYLIIATLLTFHLSAWGADQKLLKPELKANFFRFNFMRFSTEVTHNEMSSSPGYEAFTRRNGIDENNFDFILGRELFRKYYLSLSPYVIGRLIYGVKADEGAGSGSNIDYEESLEGFGYGAGVSLNVNTYIYKARTQFYIGINQVQQKKKYFLRFSDTDTEERSRELETKIMSTLRQVSFGVRIFNLYNGYTFTIAVHSNGFNIDEFSQSASQGDAEFELSSNSSFKRDNNAYSIGFGGTF